MSIKLKLFGIVSLFAVVSLAIGAAGGYGIYRAGISVSDNADKKISLTEKVNALQMNLANVRLNEKELFLLSGTKNFKGKEKYYKQTLDGFGKVKTALNDLKAAYIEKNGESSKIIGEIENAAAKTEASFKNVAIRLSKGKALTDIKNSYTAYKANVGNLTDKILKLKESVHLETAGLGNELTLFQKQLFAAFLAIVSALIMLGSGLGFSVVSKISTSFNVLRNGIEAISSGKTADLPVSSSDEIGEISKVFKETADKLKTYENSEEEMKKNQANVINFLEVVSTAAEGDFTKRAPVTTDVFGSIADAFNMMTEELSSLITEVRSTARGFEEDSFNTLNLLKNMAEGSETQMIQLKNASEAVDKTARATQEILEKSQDATGLSIKATEAALKGEDLVAQSIEGMQLIRAAVQTINKKMKMFSERIIEIGTISGMIADISARTNLLSMNASIEAARAGEAGKGFVVIAEEIRTLADKSAGATRDITNIIRSIQTEAGQITSSLEEETEIVEKQSGLQSETKSFFAEITSAIDKSKGMVSEILPLSQTQRVMTSDVVHSMENVNHISLDLIRLVQNSEGISAKLADSSKKLISSVEKFKLLETEGLTTLEGSAENEV